MVVRLHHQRDTIDTISVKCGISSGTTKRVLKKFSLSRPCGVQPTQPPEEPVPGAAVRLVSNPCWQPYCGDPRCIYHGERDHVR